MEEDKNQSTHTITLETNEETSQEVQINSVNVDEPSKHNGETSDQVESKKVNHTRHILQNIKDTDWYIRDYVAQEELRHNLYRDVPSILMNPERGMKLLYRELKKNRIYMLRNYNRKLNSLKNTVNEENQKNIEEMETSIRSLESLDLFAVIKSILPSLFMIKTPKNYQKSISKELQVAQDLLLKKNDIQKCIKRLSEMKSIRKNQYTSVEDEIISKSIQATQKENTVNLDKLSKKRRRAAEYKLRMQAESKGSLFLSKLNTTSSLGSSSAKSRQEAARNTLLSMNMADTIDQKLKQIDEQQKTKKTNPEKKNKRKKSNITTPSEPSKPTLQPLHPSWAAKNASREKQKLHIDLNAPTQNKKIVFD